MHNLYTFLILKCAKMVMKHFHEKKIEAQKAAKASEMHQKRITGFIAKMIKTFWSNVEKACTNID